MLRTTTASERQPVSRLRTSMFRTFWGVLSARAEREGERIAILQGERSVTFGAWHARASAFGNWFLASGGAPGDRVLLWMDSSPEMAAAILGLWKAGAIVAMMDPRSKASHFEHALGVVQPATIVCDRLDSLPAAAPGVRVCAWNDIDLDAPHPDASFEGLPTDPAYIIFTSGSTGLPKGATQSHDHLLRGYDTVAGYLGITPDDRMACVTPLSYTYGSGQMFCALLRGATVVLPVALDVGSLCDAIARHRPTTIAVIPSILMAMVWGLSPLRQIDASSLRIMLTAGARMPDAVLAAARQLLPRCAIVVNYGLTESLRTTYLEPGELEARPTSVGRAIPGVAVHVVREDGTEAAPRELGEIVHRGDYLFLGYWNDPAATAKVLRPDPLAPAGAPNPPPALFTGDVGYVDEDGFLFVEGRRDGLIKSMGVRVNPFDVEQLIFKSGLVAEAAIVGRPHEMLGHEIWAVIVPDPSLAGTAVRERLFAYARGAMAPYMVPRRVLVKDALPRTSTGKVDYRALALEIDTLEAERTGVTSPGR